MASPSVPEALWWERRVRLAEGDRVPTIGLQLTPKGVLPTDQILSHRPTPYGYASGFGNKKSAASGPGVLAPDSCSLACLQRLHDTLPRETWRERLLLNVQGPRVWTHFGANSYSV